jgi:hypothetical protein
MRRKATKNTIHVDIRHRVQIGLQEATRHWFAFELVHCFSLRAKRKKTTTEKRWTTPDKKFRRTMNDRRHFADDVFVVFLRQSTFD